VNTDVVENEKHFCASVWIITKSNPQKILLLLHKKLNRWLQPGGHIERFENPVEAAIREVKEETGIDISFLKKDINKIDEEGTILPTPKFIMEQTIPPHKNHPKHYHLDIQYVVKIPAQKVKLSKQESKGIRWFTKKEALALSIHEDTKVVINNIMK
jgi:8-oxo-dGTP pyrophosphatase MutT (NUDIX family)